MNRAGGWDWILVSALDDPRLRLLLQLEILLISLAGDVLRFKLIAFSGRALNKQ